MPHRCCDAPAVRRLCIGNVDTSISDAILVHVLTEDTEGTHEAMGREASLLGPCERFEMNSGTVIVVDVERSKSAEEHVRKRLDEGQCIGCKADPKPHKKRGLCDKCHSRFLRAKNSLGTKQKRAEFEAKLIKAGQLLDEDEIRQFTNQDPYADLAARMNSK